MSKRNRTHSQVILLQEPARSAQRPPRVLPPVKTPSSVAAKPPVTMPPVTMPPVDLEFVKFSRRAEQEERLRLLDRAEQKQRTPERQSLRARMHELHYRGEFFAWRRDRVAEAPYWFASLGFMLLAVALLGVMALPPQVNARDYLAGGEPLEGTEPVFLKQSVLNNEAAEDLELHPIDAPLAAPTAITITWQDSGLAPAPGEISMEAVPPVPAVARTAALVPERPFGLLAFVAPELMQRVGSPPAGKLAHRELRHRSRMLEQAGGTAESERAVTVGLNWLAARQTADGSWPAEETAMQDGAKTEPKIAATALALLPFLGAGNSTERGLHNEVVTRGVRYLASKLPATPSAAQPAVNAVQLEARALTALALCEAYALSPEPALAGHAQSALDVLAAAQDPITGGWRTAGGTPASPSTMAWYVAALSAAREAGLRTPERTLAGATHYFAEQGAVDGAIEAVISADPCTSAAGVLARAQLLGAAGGQGEETLARVAARGPDRKDVEHNFHATQALYRLKSPAWPTWNAALRDQAVAAQGATGPDRGSWLANSGASRQRETALTLLTLEVYYRVAPLGNENEAGE